ncbi:MAG: hypothetical protein HFH86_02895 [Bacilli bacterium]|nr:hypothetical protein [Bacilli bacterium]
MKKKGPFLTISIMIVVFVLITGVSYAYFSALFQDNRDLKQDTTKLKTCKLAEATLIFNVPDTVGSFVTADIYPGHKEVMSFGVAARGDLGAISNFKFLYRIKENGLGDNIKISVYKNKEMISSADHSFGCEKRVETIAGQARYYETCEEKNFGSLIQETILTSNEDLVTIGQDSLIVSDGIEEIRYYYVVIEFFNQDMSQNPNMNTRLIGNVDVELSTQKVNYKEAILNGTDPILKDELIPVMIEDDGTVRQADEVQEWYRYEESRWANAVILKNENEKYCPGEIIPEDQIESYFVWIPKYRYQLWDLGNYSNLTSINNTKLHEIPILFGDYDTEDLIDGECTTPMISGASGNCQVGDFMTHPAFISFATKGFWVGKFETGYKGSTDTTSSQKNGNEPNSIQIKPNVNSWRNINVSNAYLTSFDYKRNLDSHMMKNTEWGAVAYLQHSKYGSMASVRLNNNSNFVTGYSAVKEPTCGYTGDNRECNRYGDSEDITKPWNTSVGYLGSTTGNISGIYDMSGGAYEYVMGLMLDKEGQPMSGHNFKYNSGFSGPFGCPNCNGDTSGLTELVDGIPFPSNQKYYDIYLYGEKEENYNRRILGDATGEMGPFVSNTYGTQQRQIGSWYADEAWISHFVEPWIHRGAGYSYGMGGGIFSFISSWGTASPSISFRIVLVGDL